MAYQPKKVNRPWVKERVAFDRERSDKDFDYNGRKWRDVRAWFLAENPLCKECEAEGIVTLATVADHEPQAKVLIANGRDPYDVKYLQPLCKTHHNSKSGRERHRGG